MSTQGAVALHLTLEDVSGQKRATVRDVPADSTIGELIDGALRRMRLPDSDADGRPIAYQGRSDRLGRHLHNAERVTDAVQEGDKVTLLPEVKAGGIPQ